LYLEYIMQAGTAGRSDPCFSIFFREYFMSEAGKYGLITAMG
jgi:hypothetical protein